MRALRCLRHGVCVSLLWMAMAMDVRDIREVSNKRSSCDAAVDSRYPRQYVAPKASTPPMLDGKLDDAIWQRAEWTADFVDIAAGPTPRKRTRAKIAWDDVNLYVAADMEEDELWANVTQDQEVIFHDNDFEIFVDPAGSTHYYKEFEVNALGKVWDLCLNKPYGNGGYENSSRVFKDSAYSMGAKVGVHLDGELNNALKTSNGWTVEVALPIASLLVNQTGAEPRPGSYWRLSFSRVQWRVLRDGARFIKDPAFPAEDNWVWQHIGKISMHEPERWGILQFAESPTAPVRDPMFPLRLRAAGIYDLQTKWAKLHDGSFTSDVDALLGIADEQTRQLFLSGGSWCSAKPFVQLTADGYEATLKEEPSDLSLAAVGHHEARIRQDRYLTVSSTP